MVQAAGIAASSVSFGTALVAICTAMTMIQEKKFTVMLGSICCASSCATLAGICVAVQWLYPWSPSQALVCNIVAGKISSILCNTSSISAEQLTRVNLTGCHVLDCSTVGSVLQFLYSRAMLVDEQARSTTLMKVIQVGIVGVLPFAAFTAAVSRGHVDETFGVCVSHYPVYVAVLFVLATATFSVLLIYKFTASLREHQARLATTDRKSGGGQARNDNLEQVARRNLFYSSIALGGTTSTMVYLLINDIVVDAFDPFNMAVENLIAIVDVTINITVICTCSTAYNIYVRENLRGLVADWQCLIGGYPEHSRCITLRERPIHRHPPNPRHSPPPCLSTFHSTARVPLCSNAKPYL